MADLIFIAGGGKGLTETAIIPSVTINVEHNMENTLSKYPIEKSTDGAYNAVVRNNVITINGAFSNIHLPSVLFESSTPDILGNVVLGNTTAKDNGDQPPVTGLDRPQAAFDLVKDARDTLKFLDIVTGYITYKDCLIQSFNVTEDKNTGGLLSFELVFEQPRFTEVTNAVSANMIKPLADSGAGNDKLSVQEKKDASEIEDKCKGSTIGIFGFEVSTEAVCRNYHTLVKSGVN